MKKYHVQITIHPIEGEDINTDKVFQSIITQGEGWAKCELKNVLIPLLDLIDEMKVSPLVSLWIDPPIDNSK